MQTDEFEWDDDKATRNLIKHRVSFAQATFAFDDPDGFDELDEETAELRYKWIGHDGQRLLVVIYTERCIKRRIISAREAEPDERSEYEANRRP
jgi:uncharacterized DUF497 family protein